MGIEKNEEVHLFKKERIDYIKVAQERLEEVRVMLERKEEPPALFSALQPSARNGTIKRRGMVDVDEVLQQGRKEAV